MVNFIIYEDRESMRKTYDKIIHKFMGDNDISYKIYQFSSYNNLLKDFIVNNTGHNIYILDIEVPGKSGLDLAREIRSSGDAESQLIIVTAHKEMLENNFLNRSLVLNFVSKFDNCEENLLATLKIAYVNATRHRSFAFKSDGELYLVPYDDIYYFGIETKAGHVQLYTKTKTFIVRKTISSIIDELNDPRFMKIHKSCIVNLYNIEKVDMNSLMIYFPNNTKTELLSRNYKRELQERLMSR